MRTFAGNHAGLKGTGFSPYILLAVRKRALAPEGRFSDLLSFLIANSAFFFLLIFIPLLQAQSAPPATATGPIAIVPLDSNHPEAAPSITGALEVTASKAIIAASGEITSGNRTTEVTLPHRGVLRVCAATTVKLAADSSVPAGETPGLMMALEHGAVELSFATARNADILLTPDFRILIGAPGAAEVKVRLGPHGDTCVDNAGGTTPYVLVTSVFDSGDYRVLPGQRVMFQHGSLREVVDNEKEPCGCPPAPQGGNEFPLAQSEGLAPLPKAAPNAIGTGTAQTAPIEPLVYKASAAPPVADATSASAAATPSAGQTGQATPPKKPGFFGKVGRFFRRLFGAE